MDNNCTGAPRILSVVANKWTAAILHCLAESEKRPNELMHQIEGISQKMLTQTLRQLERGGLVGRRVHAVVPPRVDYGLTPLGASLIGPLQGLVRWAHIHADEIEAVEPDGRLPLPASRTFLPG